MKLFVILLETLSGIANSERGERLGRFVHSYEFARTVPFFPFVTLHDKRAERSEMDVNLYGNHQDCEYTKVYNRVNQNRDTASGHVPELNHSCPRGKLKEQSW